MNTVTPAVDAFLARVPRFLGEGPRGAMLSAAELALRDLCLAEGWITSRMGGRAWINLTITAKGEEARRALRIAQNEAEDARRKVELQRAIDAHHIRVCEKALERARIDARKAAKKG